MHDRVGRQYLTRASGCRYTCRGRDGDPPDFLPGELCLADVETGPDVQPELPHLLNNRESTAHTLSGAREGREEPVPSGIDLVASVALQLFADLSVVSRLEAMPPIITEFTRHFAGCDNVCEEQGDESTLVPTSAHHRSECAPAPGALQLKMPRRACSILDD